MGSTNLASTRQASSSSLVLVAKLLVLVSNPQHLPWRLRQGELICIFDDIPKLSHNETVPF